MGAMSAEIVGATQATEADIARGASSAAAPALARRLRELEQRPWCLSGETTTHTYLLVFIHPPAHTC
eukprot:COSAG05_NODE_303_length_11737_cov_116.354270_4_plen_67_part_00